MGAGLWIKTVRESQSDYKIPPHTRSFFYTLGGIIFTGFLLMVVTGLILTQLYNPAPEQAYESLQKIQQSGWASFVRSLHHWIAQGIIVALLLHIARVFITGGYKYPRQVTWWIGVALFATMLMGSYFTGTILKWDEEGMDALAHYQESLKSLGPIGALLTESLSGSAPMNIRIFTSHIAVFPILIIALVLLHLFLIRIFGISPTPKDQWADQPTIPKEEMTVQFTEHARHIALFAAIFYGILAILAFFVPAPLQGPPISGHDALKPPWPFLWMYGFENIWGVVAVLYASAVLFGFLALVPLLDKKQDRRFQSRKPILFLGAIMAISLIGLTLHGKLTPAQKHMHSHGEDAPHQKPHEELPLNQTPHSDSNHSDEKDHHDAKPHAHPDTEEGHDGK